jgi:hypothetical protein
MACSEKAGVRTDDILLGFIAGMAEEPTAVPVLLIEEGAPPAKDCGTPLCLRNPVKQL